MRSRQVKANAGSHDKIMFGKVILAERSRPKKKHFSRPEMRLCDLEELIHARYLGPVPEHDDVLDPYLFAAANAVVAMAPAEPYAYLTTWIERYEPWRTPHRLWAETAIGRLKTSRLMSDKNAGKNLKLKLSERHLLNLKTVSPSDVSEEVFSSYLADKKRKADRERDARKRARSGSLSYEAYIAREKNKSDATLKKINEMGVSRATYFRRKKTTKQGNETRFLASLSTTSNTQSKGVENHGEKEVSKSLRLGSSLSRFSWPICEEPSLTKQSAHLFESAAVILQSSIGRSEGEDQ